LVQLGVGEPLVTAHQGDSLPDRVRDSLEQISVVVLHRTSLSGSGVAPREGGLGSPLRGREGMFAPMTTTGSGAIGQNVPRHAKNQGLSVPTIHIEKNCAPPP